jgi:hypothetical protein
VLVEYLQCVTSLPPPSLRNSTIAVHAIYGILLQTFDIYTDYVDDEISTSKCRLTRMLHNLLQQKVVT